MKRFFSELSVLMKKRKHLLFLIILWSICALTLLMFSKGLDSTVEDSFGKNPPVKSQSQPDQVNNPAVNPVNEGVSEKKEYTYELDVKNMDSVDKLVVRKALNKLLTESKDFDYYSYYVSSGTVVGLKNPAALDISTRTKTSQDDQGAFHTNYEVRVFFIDRNTAVRSPFAKKLATLFDGDMDYDAILPVYYDYAWIDDVQSLTVAEGYSVSRVKTIDEEYSIDYKLAIKGFINLPGDEAAEKSQTISLGNKNYDLTGAIIIPLRDIGTASSSGNPQSRREYWEHIYDMRNRGVIISDMKPDELQKYMDKALAENDATGNGKKLSDFFRIRINEADYNNKLLYNDKINDIRRHAKNIAMGAVIIAGALLIMYLLISISRNQRYEFLAYINGTGKIEFWLIYVLQIAIWFVFTVFPSYALYFGIMKIVKTNFVDLKEYFTFPAIIAAIGFVVVTLRLLIWNTGKILRRI